MSKSPSPYIIQDGYFRLAKQQWYRARSAFKLIEIDERFRLIQPGMKVLDIGAAPGSFLQVVSKIVGEKWLVIGIDIQRIEHLGKANVFTYVQDIFDHTWVLEKIAKHTVTQFDCIVSDIAPSTTGMSGVDQYRSVELNLAILEVAKKMLKPNWNLLLKVFVGEDYMDLMWPLKRNFEEVKRFKPKACRDRSFEEYFICFGHKKTPV